MQGLTTDPPQPMFRVNGKPAPMPNSNTRFMTFKIPQIIEYIAGRMTLEAGDVIGLIKPDILAASGRFVVAALEILRVAGAELDFDEQVDAVLAPEVVFEDAAMTEGITHDPLGVVANISAWNYPWFVGGNVFVPALLAGNAVILGCCDVVIATEGSNIGMGGPAMIEGGGLGIYRPEEVGPMDVQVHEYTAQGRRVLSTECIVCLTCTSVCPKQVLGVVMGPSVSTAVMRTRVGQPSSRASTSRSPRSSRRCVPARHDEQAPSGLQSPPKGRNRPVQPRRPGGAPLQSRWRRGHPQWSTLRARSAGFRTGTRAP